MNNWNRCGGRPPIFEFYITEFPLPDEGNFRATCKVCNTSISASRRATSNLISHMKRKHPGVYQDPSLTGSRQDLQMIPVTQTVQQYGHTDQRQQQITESLIDLLAGNLLDPSLVDSQEFRRFTTLIDRNYEPPSSIQLIYSLLPGRRWTLQQRAMLMLEAADSVAITQDVWVNNGTCICICGHFILNWTLRTVFLACRYFVNTDLSESIAQLYEETTAHYKLGTKVSHTTVYNATSVIKSFHTSLPGFSVCDETTTQEPDDDSTSFNVNLDSKDLTSPFADSLGCFAEALQLCVSEGLKDEAVLESTINKVSGVVDLVRSLVLPTGSLECIRQTMEVGYSTWNSQLKIVKAACTVSLESFQSVAPSLLFTVQDLEILKEFVEIMEPFEEAFNLSRTESRITASYVIPCIRGLNAHLNSFKAVHLKEIIKKLKSLVSIHLSKYESNETYILCSMLDPRFKLRWCPDEKHRQFTSLLSSKVQEITGDSPLEVMVIEDPPEKKSKLFQFMSSEPAAGLPQCWEVTSYLATPCVPEVSCPLEFWKQHQLQYPVLSKMASSMLNIPATASHILNMSKVGDKITNPTDFKLNGVTFENLMFIKCNQTSR